MEANIADKVKAFFEKYPKRTYPKDQIIVFGGESPDKVYYVVSGKISQYDISYRGDEIVINVFKPPAFFPMTWAINKSPNVYFYKAEEDTVVYTAPPNEVVLFLKENPDAMFDLLSRLYRGVDGLLGRMVHLMSSSARSRLIYEIITECRRFGKKVAPNSYSITLHESDLAARSGLARETISREMKHLKTQGLISFKDRLIIVHDFKVLKQKISESV